MTPSTPPRPLSSTTWGAAYLCLAIVAGSIGCARKATPADAPEPTASTNAPAEPGTPTEPTSTDAGPTEPASPEPSPGGPAPAEETEQSEVQQRFESFVAERNSCKADSECVLVSPGCPLGCGTGVRPEHAAAVEAKARELLAEAEKDGGRCVYRCAALEPKCVDSRCTAVTQ